MDLGLAPCPLGFGAMSAWVWRHAGLGSTGLWSSAQLGTDIFASAWTEGRNNSRAQRAPIVRRWSNQRPLGTKANPDRFEFAAGYGAT
jgi:hypothetical protein